MCIRDRTMTICILPTIVRTTEESLLAVPESYKEGALALGAGKTRVVLCLLYTSNRLDGGFPCKKQRGLFESVVIHSK